MLRRIPGVNGSERQPYGCNQGGTTVKSSLIFGLGAFFIRKNPGDICRSSTPCKPSEHICLHSIGSVVISHVYVFSSIIGADSSQKFTGVQCGAAEPPDGRTAGIFNE